MCVYVVNVCVRVCVCVCVCPQRLQNALVETENVKVPNNPLERN